MRIGIDIDGVVFDTEKVFRNYAELYDILVLKRKSLKDNRELWIQQRYNWSEEEENEFLNKYLVKCSLVSHIMPGAKEVLELLKMDGHELVVISARGNDIPVMKDIAEEMIKNEGLVFDRCYWKMLDKVETAVNEKIDIMIEDNLDNCMALSKVGIKTIYLRDSHIKKSNDKNIYECYLWSEIYRYILDLEGRNYDELPKNFMK